MFTLSEFDEKVAPPLDYRNLPERGMLYGNLTNIEVFQISLNKILPYGEGWQKKENSERSFRKKKMH